MSGFWEKAAERMYMCWNVSCPHSHWVVVSGCSIVLVRYRLAAVFTSSLPVRMYFCIWRVLSLWLLAFTLSGGLFADADGVLVFDLAERWVWT